MRKLLWVCHFLPYPSTGHGALQRTHHLIRQASRRYEVHLFVAAPVHNEAQIALALGVHSIQGIAPRGTYSRSLALVKSCLSQRPYWEMQFYDSSLHEALCLAAKDKKAVVVLDTIFLAPYMRQINGNQIVVNHHNIESLLLKQRSGNLHGPQAAFFSLQASATRRLERRVCPAVKNNLIVSAEDGRRLLSVAPHSDFSVVANGVDTEYFTRGPSSPSPRPYSLVFAGGMDWYPNSDAMRWLSEEIWPYLAAREPGCTLTVIGRSPPHELVALSHRDSRVRVLGFVDDVRSYIQEASMYICPIRQGGGTRLKVLDALALECPLVATDISVDGLALEEGRHYLRANSLEEVYSAFCKLNSNPDIGKQLASAGREYVVENFSWNRIGNKLFEAFDRIEGN